ncbi:MAG: hypothetical protein KA052_02970 [Candidatus Pacebacteria bacterium]|nr:hypothetical protein [Candidatus Paceibacterota bacterium]
MNRTNNSTINALLGQHEDSDGNYTSLISFAEKNYLKAKKQSMSVKNVPHELGIYEKNLIRGLQEKSHHIVAGSLENLKRIYQDRGISPTMTDFGGKYVAISFLNDFHAFADIMLETKDSSGWKKH